jgi:hypothetical protein
VLNRIVVSAVAALSCLVLAGCFVPGDPEGPPVGLRVEQGVLVVYLPLCSGEKVVSGHIDNPNGGGKPFWTGEQPTRPADKIIKLGRVDWGKQSGAFSYDGQEFGLNVVGTVRNYGTSAIDRKLIVDLPDGTYDLDGKRVTAAEIDQKSDCKKSG